MLDSACFPCSTTARPIRCGRKSWRRPLRGKKGHKLAGIPVQHTSWSDWKTRYPETKVLSTRIGAIRNYEQNPYKDYEASKFLMFPVYNKAPEKLHPKERVLGVEIKSVYKAYPFIELNKQGDAVFTDMLNNETLSIHWDSVHQSGRVTDKDNKLLVTIESYWFAWYAFHPDTEIYKAE